MSLSSKLIACVCLATFAVAPTVAATGRPGMAARPVVTAPRLPTVRNGIIGRSPDGRRLAGRSRGRRRGFGWNYAGFGLGLAGEGLDAGDAALASAAGPDGAPDLPPLPPPIFLPMPPACPLIIKVGRGLAHPAPSRVVYGRPFCRS